MTTEDAVSDPFRTRQRVAWRLGISQTVFVLATLPVWAFLGLEKMEGGSALRQTLLNIAVAGYPLAVLVGAVLAWRCWRRASYPSALRWTTLPLLWLVPIGTIVYLRSF